jgi:hypothetical protein
MRIASALLLPLLAAACSLSQPHLRQDAHAPAGWEPFCFPATIAYLPGMDRISPGTERMMPAIYEMSLGHTGWLLLSVSGGADPNNRAARELANRRAQAALRLLSRLGTRPERVEVRIYYEGEIYRADRDLSSASPDAGRPMDWAAHVVMMIPPEWVEGNHALQREHPGLVFC